MSILRINIVFFGPNMAAKDKEALENEDVNVQNFKYNLN